MSYGHVALTLLFEDTLLHCTHDSDAETSNNNKSPMHLAHICSWNNMGCQQISGSLLAYPKMAHGWKLYGKPFQAQCRLVSSSALYGLSGFGCTRRAYVTTKTEPGRRQTSTALAHADDSGRALRGNFSECSCGGASIFPSALNSQFKCRNRLFGTHVRSCNYNMNPDRNPHENKGVV
jgi:hypothetical protein